MLRFSTAAFAAVSLFWSSVVSTQDSHAAEKQAISEASGKARGLVEALPYIQRFHNKVVVVKVGGSIMDDEQALGTILTDIAFMNYVGMQPVIVHGGGKA